MLEGMLRRYEVDRDVSMKRRDGARVKVRSQHGAFRRVQIGGLAPARPPRKVRKTNTVLMQARHNTICVTFCNISARFVVFIAM